MNELPISEGFLQQVERLQTIVKNNVAGLFGGNHQSKTYGASCDFADYRDYMPGDDIKKIDWNAYARFDRLYYKLYLDERQVHTRIYIDVSRSMGYGHGKKEVQAIRIAATIAYLSVCEMDKVSIYALREHGAEEIISSMFGRERYYREIIKLNELTFDGDSHISDGILPSVVGYGDGMSVIISDFLTDNDYESAIDYLASKKRDVFCMQVLSSEELAPKARGKMHFFDSENIKKEYRKNIGRDVLNAYRQAVEYATERVRGYCAARGGEYVLVPAELSMEKLFFGMLADKGVLK